MKYIEATEYPDTNLSVFLAGGITNCPDWQKEMVGLLEEAAASRYLTVFNPRRKEFNVRDPFAAENQIRWEHQMLQRADAILFWFCESTLCPITLYELGVWSMSRKPIFVGVEDGYKRTSDVRIQTNLIRPEVRIRESLEELVNDVVTWVTFE